MLNVENLEKKWIQYKIKAYTPYILGGILTIALILSGLYLFINQKEKASYTQTKHDTTLNTSIETLTKKENSVITPEVKREINKTKTTTQTVLKEEKPQHEAKSSSAQKKVSQKLTQENHTPLNKKQVDSYQSKLIQKSAPSTHNIKKIILQPSLGFMQILQQHYTPTTEIESKQKNIQSENIEIVEEPTDNIIQKEEKIIPEVEVKIEKVEAEPETKNVSIEIKKQNTYEDIDLVIKRFKRNNNPALSLFVAKKYYELGEYKQAYNYALITNDINNDIEESWIIFSKSLVKLNQKQKAIETLKEFINYSNSNEAKLLLEEIKSGKFK